MLVTFVKILRHRIKTSENMIRWKLFGSISHVICIAPYYGEAPLLRRSGMGRV